MLIVTQPEDLQRTGPLGDYREKVYDNSSQAELKLQ